MTALEVLKKLNSMVNISYYLTPSEYKTLIVKIEEVDKPVAQCAKAPKKVIKKDC